MNIEKNLVFSGSLPRLFLLKWRRGILVSIASTSGNQLMPPTLTVIPSTDASSEGEVSDIVQTLHFRPTFAKFKSAFAASWYNSSLTALLSPMSSQYLLLMRKLASSG